MRSSSSSSCSTRRPWNKDRRRRRRVLSTRISASGSSGVIDDQRDRCRQALPLRGFLLESATAFTRQRVVLGATVVLAVSPLRFDPSLLLQLVQRGIERALTHLQNVVRHLADPLRQCPAVHRLERDDLENQKIQRALYEVSRLAHGSFS